MRLTLRRVRPTGFKDTNTGTGNEGVWPAPKQQQSHQCSLRTKTCKVTSVAYVTGPGNNKFGLHQGNRKVQWVGGLQPTRSNKRTWQDIPACREERTHAHHRHSLSVYRGYHQLSQKQRHLPSWMKCTWESVRPGITVLPCRLNSGNPKRSKSCWTLLLRPRTTPF